MIGNAIAQKSPIPLPNNAAIGPCLRVKMASGFLALAGAADNCFGVMERRSLATDTVGEVAPYSAFTILHVVAAGAVALHADLYRAASGMVDDTVNGDSLGFALDAAVTSGDVIRMLCYGSAKAGPVTEAHTADDTLLASESGSMHSSVGAAGTVDLTLPAALPGMEFFFRVGATQVLRVSPATGETISLPSTGAVGVASKGIEADAIGESVQVRCVTAGTWTCFGHSGTWAAEA